MSDEGLLTGPEQIAMIASFRCSSCQRNPMPKEITEMQVAFGHKLQPGDRPRIVWICGGCKQKGGSA